MHDEVRTIPETRTDPRYARCVENSRRVRWDIDRDVIRGRELDFSGHFLPDGLSRIGQLRFLSQADARLLSQIQGRTYANMFGLVERFINAKVLDLARDHQLGDQAALEAMVGFSLEELKHQELFRRLERMISPRMPPGYTFVPEPDEVAAVVLGRSSWAVLALTCHIELFVQAHYLEAIQPDSGISPVFKDVFLFHWKEESQHAILDELEWTRVDAKLTDEERETGVNDFIALVGAVDGILQVQAAADAAYFLACASGTFGPDERQQIEQGVLRAYRWQYILSGAEHPRFQKALTRMVTPAQLQRVFGALAPIAG